MMDLDGLPRRIRELRTSQGLTQAAFAKLVGVSQGTISKWESGDDKPDFENLSRLAEISGEAWQHSFDIEGALEKASAAALKSQGDFALVKVVGTVQAGQWIEAVEWDDADGFDIISPIPAGWPDAILRGFRVRGTSMDQLYPDGSIVVATPTIANEINPQHGDRVIVQRRDSRGRYEVTLKEMAIDGQGRIWLWPRSHDPEFQAPIKLTTTDGDSEVEEVTVIGIVVASIRVERPERFAHYI